MIPIEVRSLMDAHESEIQEFAERRVKFALDHLRNVRRIAISVTDVNGPKGGADKHCRIVAEVGFASVVLEETQPDWQSAVARAIHRLDRKATQELQRTNSSSSHSTHRSYLRGNRTHAGHGDDLP